MNNNMTKEEILETAKVIINSIDHDRECGKDESVSIKQLGDFIQFKVEYYADQQAVSLVGFVLEKVSVQFENNNILTMDIPGLIEEWKAPPQKPPQ